MRNLSKREVRKSVLKSLGFVAIFVMVFDPSLEAEAYLDPGTGSMILQLLIGGVAGAIMVVKLYWEKFKNLFRRK